MLSAFLAPLAYLFIRNRPEEYGLQPDGAGMLAGGTVKDDDGRDAGADAATNDDADTTEVREENWTRGEALRTTAYWVFSMGLASIAMLSTGLTFHMVKIFADSGMDATLAARVYFPVAFVSAGVTLVSGILVDRISARFLMAGSLFLQVVALLMAPYLSGPGMALLYGVVLGFLFGMMRTVASVVWAVYFGRQHLGSIAGVTSSILVAASALGPLPMGYARELFGSYTWVLAVSSLLPLVLGIASLFVQRPRKAA